MNPLLDNIAWHTSDGPARQVRHRHRPRPPLRARLFADRRFREHRASRSRRPRLRSATPGDHFYCMDWSGAAPAGWRIELDSTMFRMVWDGAMPETTRRSMPFR